MNRLNNTVNVRLIAATIVPDGNMGKITWTILKKGNSPHIISLAPKGDDLVLNLANVIKIQSLIVWPNKTAASFGIMAGAEIDGNPNIIPISFYQKTGSQGGYFRGNGSTGFNAGGDVADWTTQVTVSDIQYNPKNAFTSGDTSQKNIQAVYVGSTANRAIAKIFSGLSLNFGHRIINNTTMAAITGSNSDADVVDVISNTPRQTKLNPNFTDSQGFPSNLFTTAVAFYIYGIVEVKN